MAIRISKHQLYIGAASVAMVAFMAAPAQAQYHTLKSQEPQVELNLDRLSSGEAGPAARPLWQPKAETPPNQMPAGTPPIKLRQPLKMPENMAILPAPSVADVPIAAKQPAAKAVAEDETETAAPAAEAQATEAVGQTPEASRVLKPVFAAPVVPPAAAAEAAPAEAPADEQIAEEATEAVEQSEIAEAAAEAKAEVAPAPAPAAPAQSELKPAKLMDPILEPEAPAKSGKKADKKADKKASAKEAVAKPDLLPTRKPETAAADAPKAAEKTAAAPAPEAVPVPAPKPAAKVADKVMSYPPTQQQKAAPVTRYERPVLPQGLGGNYDAPAPNTAAPAAPAAATAAAHSSIPPQPANDIKLDGVVIPADIQEDPTEAAPVEAVAQEEQPQAAPVATADEAGEEMPATVMTSADLDTPAEAAQSETVKAEPAKQETAKAAEEPAAPARRPSLVVSQDPAPAQRQDTIPARMAAPAADDMAVPTLSDLTLEFDGVSSDLSEGTQQKLVNLLPILKEDEGRRLAVHAYASGEDGSKSSARRISLSRALAVRAFLMDNGVKPTRVDVRALGLETDRKPLERVDLVFAR